jgi:hypothetical protein
MDGYIQSATEDGLAPPRKHTMSLFCQYAPYRLAEGTWEERREEIGRNVVRTLGEYAPNLPGAVEGMEVLGPPDIEERIGITGGNIFHGEILPHAHSEPLPLRCRHLAGRGRLRRPRPQLRDRGARGRQGRPTGELMTPGADRLTSQQRGDKACRPRPGA